MHSHFDYGGNNQCMAGDGSRLRISGIGSSSFTSPHATLRLNNILHVPGISRNLISVAQFTKNNSCHFVFYPSGFVIKDLKSQKVLFQGPLSNGLYPLRLQIKKPTPPKVALPQVFSLQPSSPSLWHNRCGHPAVDVMSRIMGTL